MKVLLEGPNRHNDQWTGYKMTLSSENPEDAQQLFKILHDIHNPNTKTTCVVLGARGLSHDSQGELQNGCLELVINVRGSEL